MGDQTMNYLKRIFDVMQKQSPQSVFKLGINKGGLTEQIVSEIEAQGAFTTDDLERLCGLGIDINVVSIKGKPNPLVKEG